MVKTALIAGGELWERVRSGADPTSPEVIAACARTKLRIVAQDERDAGLRQVLNLGHTVAHAIEAVTGYARYRHGEAVALGLLAALALSEQRDLRDEVHELLARPRAAHRASRRRPRRGGDGHGARQEADGGRAGAVRPARLPGRAAPRLPGRAARTDRRRARVGSVNGVRNRVEVMHGVNLDQLGRRDPEHYGSGSLDELEMGISRTASTLGLEVRFFQTNHEGQFVEHLHRLEGMADGIVLNPGAWTHYSYAIRDALELTRLPAVEVHLSDIEAREPWRRESVIRDLVIGRVAGKGADGYREALELLSGELSG